MNKKDLIVKWLKKYEICGNDAWWNDEIYYSLTLDQICDIVNYVNQKSGIKKEDEYLRVIEDLCDKLKKSVVMNSSFAKIINIIKSNPETVDMTSIAEILKNCPKGTKLYSLICGECYLYCVEDGEIRVNDNSGIIYSFYKDGMQHPMGECLLFPSKENRDWSTFNYTKRFKKGDFIHNRDWTCIYYGVNDNGAIQFFAFIPWDWNRNTSTERYDVRPTEKPKIGIGYINNETRLATEAEKTLLLTAIEYQGCVWDGEKLELRKKEPYIRFFGKKEPEFKPFDKVLVRDFDDSKWIPSLYGFKAEIPSPIHIVAGGGKWKQCIQYEGNEHLLGTTENCE